MHSLNIAPPDDIPPVLQRTNSSTLSASLKHRAPSLPLESADPLNALSTETNDSAVKSITGALEASYKLLWNKVQLVEPPRTLDDVRRLISRPFMTEDHTDPAKEKFDLPNSLGKLIVGSSADHKTPSTDEGRGNIMYVICFNQADRRTSGFRTLGTSLSRPFSSSTRTPPPTQIQNKSQQQREMQEMASEGLSGTQSRQIIAVDSSNPESSRRKIKRVDARFLESEPLDLKVRDIELLVRELRRVVLALDEVGGFEDGV